MRSVPACTPVRSASCPIVNPVKTSTFCFAISIHYVEVCPWGKLPKAYGVHRARAFSSAMRVLGDHAAAEDVVQDVFLALWRDPSLYDPARGSLGRIRGDDGPQPRGGPRALPHRRAPGVERLGVRDGSARGRRTARTTSPPRTTGAACWRPVAKLPVRQREAILLAFGTGLTAAEIADASGVPVGTAKSRLRLGLQKTRDTLAA